MNRAGPLLTIGLTAAVLLFAVQNLTTVPIVFLMWHIETSVSLVVLGPFLIGLLVGTLGGLRARGRRAGTAPAAPGAPPAGQR
jgi:uncharacterized integral membrane protein